MPRASWPRARLVSDYRVASENERESREEVVLIGYIAENNVTYGLNELLSPTSR
jgi:hypothetical protein